MEVKIEVEESASRKGRCRVLVEGIQTLGAIMKNPWLHTAFSKLKVDLPSPNGMYNVMLCAFLSSSLLLISISTEKLNINKYR